MIQDNDFIYLFYTTSYNKAEWQSSDLTELWHLRPVTRKCRYLHSVFAFHFQCDKNVMITNDCKGYSLVSYRKIPRNSLKTLFVTDRFQVLPILLPDLRKNYFPNIYNRKIVYIWILYHPFRNQPPHCSFPNLLCGLWVWFQPSASCSRANMHITYMHTFTN